MSFGELAIVAIVGLVIFGPKELPKVLRKLGQWAGKLRRMAMDLRVQSGIDDALRSEGLHEPIREIQKLTRGELDGVMRASSLNVSLDPGDDRPRKVTTSKPRREPPPVADAPAAPSAYEEAEPTDVLRDREVPAIGCDSYGALPDTAIVYVETLPRSALADEPLWAEGEDRPRAAEAKVEEAGAADGEHEADDKADAAEGEAKVA